MNITLRDAMVIGAGSVALAALPIGALAQDAPVKTADEWIAEFAAGAEVTEGEGVTLTAPEIAENGNTVPVSVEAPGATEILLLASGNPTPGVATFKFGPLAGSQKASTRMRLAKTQDVVAVAKLADGKVVKTSSEVKVTIGGCGG